MSNVTRALALVLVMGLAIAIFSQTVQVQARVASPNAVIEVYPGVNAIRKALKNANPGDTLNIHVGTYNEAVNVKKANITLRSAGDGEVIIDPQCNAVTGINMNAEGITIKGLTVRGATFYAINLEHRASGVVRGNTVDNTCPGAQYGVNVFDGGSIKVAGNGGTGWDDAVIYIGGINATPSGALVVKNTNATGSVRGIIIEDSANVNIKVLKNNVHDNTDTGILIHNSDGVLIKENTVTNNVSKGIHLDAPSDNNVVRDNTFTGHTTDILNDGTGNCFSGNTYTTSSGPIDPC